MNEDFRIEKQGSKTVLVRCYRDEETVKIPDGVTEIGYKAFEHRDRLKKIIISDSVTEIGEKTFESCRSLKEITLPDSITVIGKGAFNFCTSLESITVPDSVIEIGDSAFWYCESLIIKCSKDSSAHKYAEENHIKFELI